MQISLCYIGGTLYVFDLNWITNRGNHHFGSHDKLKSLKEKQELTDNIEEKKSKFSVKKSEVV